MKAEYVTDDKREIIKRNPIPISACEDSMLSIVEFDSTQTQGSSKYFLLINHHRDRLTTL